MPRSRHVAERAYDRCLVGVLSSGYADGLRDVFLACGIAGVVGGLLVLWLVRAAAPEESASRPATDAAPEPAAR